MLKFEVGKKYYMSSACNSECIWEYEVIKRTDKTITVLDGDGATKRLKTYEYDNSERCKPLGTYSMCPILNAEREIEVKYYQIMELECETKIKNRAVGADFYYCNDKEAEKITTEIESRKNNYNIDVLTEEQYNEEIARVRRKNFYIVTGF